MQTVYSNACKIFNLIYYILIYHTSHQQSMNLIPVDYRGRLRLYILKISCEQREVSIATTVKKN